MPTKQITVPKTYSFGRNHPTSRPKLKLSDYINLSVLPKPPASFTYAPAAYKALGKMYMNDTLGDCVIACIAHAVGVATQGKIIYDQQQIIESYSAIGGYVPGDPSTDNGCDEITAWNYWQKTGVTAGYNKISGWVAVDGSNPKEYSTALWLFENLLFGVDLPDEWISPFPSESGFTWGVAGPADENNGHCFLGTGHSTAGVEICTWGMIGTVTDSAVSKYATSGSFGELYVALNEEIVQKALGKAPNGFNWQQLQADFKNV